MEEEKEEEEEVDVGVVDDFDGSVSGDAIGRFFRSNSHRRQQHQRQEQHQQMTSKDLRPLFHSALFEKRAAARSSAAATWKSRPTSSLCLFFLVRKKMNVFFSLCYKKNVFSSGFFQFFLE